MESPSNHEVATKLLAFRESGGSLCDRVFNQHPTSARAWCSAYFYPESHLERQAGIDDASDVRNVPKDVGEAWTFLIENPDVLQQYIRSDPQGATLFFSREKLMKM